MSLKVLVVLAKGILNPTQRILHRVLLIWISKMEKIFHISTHTVLKLSFIVGFFFNPCLRRGLVYI
jgi:hypothetical protein